MKTFKVENGIDGLFIENSRFNTTFVSFNFYTPLDAAEASENALLSYVLSSCCQKYKTFAELNMALSMLYGASIGVSVNKISGMQYIKLYVSVINDEFSLNGESTVKEAIGLLTSLIFNPKTENESFFEEDLVREKRKVCELIAAEMNDKRKYARKRCTQEMFEGESGGISAIGTAELINSVSGEQLYKAWKRLLNKAYVRINIVGKELSCGIFEDIKASFSNFNRDFSYDSLTSCVLKKNNSPKSVTERLNVAQGKLVMGFSSEQYGTDAHALTVATDILGGGPYSKLFENVREKMSLCYYCAANAVKQSGYIMVDSGVEMANCEKAEAEILNQLSLLKSGEISEFEFSSSIKNITGTLMSYNDSLSTLDAWYSLYVNIDEIKTPEETADIIKNITKQQVIEAANGINLNTVYRLLPLGDENNAN